MDDREVSRGYCPCCNGIHQQTDEEIAGGTQADGSDVDFTTWRCGGCGRQWSGDLYETAPAAEYA